MVHGKIVTAEWKNESGSGRIGSGESHSLPVSTQALLFFSLCREDRAVNLLCTSFY